jgi:hypothetical protein
MPASINITRMLDEKAAIIKIVSDTEYKFLHQQFSIMGANNQWKYSPELQKNIESKKHDLPESFIITGNDIAELQSALIIHSHNVIITAINKNSNSLVVTSYFY